MGMRVANYPREGLPDVAGSGPTGSAAELRQGENRMSVRARVLLTAVSAFVWVGWLVLAWLAATGVHPPAVWLFLELVGRIAAVVLTLTSVLLWSITPFVETARIYMRIGKREEQERQDAASCGCQERRAVGATVIPIRPVKTNVLSDN